jgi:monovalent cation:H+ antiporter-2, CPA2 family
MDLMLGFAFVIALTIALLYVSQLFRIPSIVSFLIIGMLVGPFGFGIITNQSVIETIGQIGIVLLLFTIGLEFSFEKLLRSWRIVIVGGLMQVFTTIVAITLVTSYLGFHFNEALVFGFIVSLSSTAIVMKILQERGEVDTLQGRTLLGILIFQDLAIIPMILITPLLVGSGGPDLDRLPLGIAKVAGLLVIIIILAKWVIPSFLYRVAKLRNRELFFITIAGTCIIIGGLTGAAGLSVTLGAFIAGLIIGESDYNIDALSHVIPFRDVFAAIFFLSIGMLLNTRTVITDIRWVIFIVVVILVIKILTGTFSAAVLGMPARVCIFTGLSLCQIGEFSFVLAKTGLDENLIPDTVYQLFLAGAIITMALTPFAMNASPRFVDILYRVAPARFLKPGTGETEPADKDSTGHMVIAGYGATGKSVARAAEMTGIPYRVVELNPEIIRREKANRHSHFIFGDAVQQEVLEHAGIRRARALVVVVSEPAAVPRIVRTARQLSPALYIIARTQHIRNAQALLDLGADEVVSEEFEAAREIFARTLRKYQMPETEITKIVSRLKQWGYAKFIKGRDNGNNAISGMETMLHSLRVHTLRVEPGSFAEGKTVADLDLPSRIGVNDYGIRKGSTTVFLPDDGLLLSAGDFVIIFTSEQNVQKILPLFAGSQE